MDIILFISCMVGLFFGILWSIDDNFPNMFKKLVIFCIILSIVSFISLQFKNTKINYIETNILKINQQEIKFNKAVKIKETIVSRTYGTNMLDIITYEILN